MNLNKAIMVGRLTREPELREFDNFKVCNFGLAVNTKKGKDKSGQDREEEVLFIDCTAWNKLADICMQYLSKGKAVLVEGRLKLDQWEKDGKKNSKHTVVVDNMQMVGTKGNEVDSGSSDKASPDNKSIVGTQSNNFKIDNVVDDLPF